MPLDNSNRALYLKAEFKFGFWSGDTAPTQFFGPVNFTKLELASQKQELDRLISNMEDTAGEVIASVAKPTDPAGVTAEFDSMTGNLLAVLLGADTADLSQSTGGVTDEVITTVLNVWIPFANRYIETSGISLKTSGDVAVAEAKYEIDHINGLIRAIHADAVGVGMKLSYTKSTRTGEIYHAGKAKDAYLQFLGTATEKVSQKRCRIKIHKASLAPSGAVDPIAGGYFKGALNGDLLTPTGELSPWQFEYLDLASA